MTDPLSRLFEPVNVGSRTAKNRLVANPLERNMGAEDGGVSDGTVATYTALAQGRWGMVIVESTAAITDLRHRGPGKLALMLNRKTADSFRGLVDAFKSVNPDAILMVQLSPGGHGLDDDGLSLPSDDIERARDELIDAFGLAEQAGFDGVEFKLCHNVLPARLLGRLNTRQDKWGGATLDERATFARECMAAVRRELAGANHERFIVGTRISEIDIAYLRDMIRLFETDLAFDYINVSSAWPVHNATVMFMLSQCVKLAGATRPVIASGGTEALQDGKSFDRILDLLSGDLAPELIGFGRQNLADPLMPRKIMDGRLDTLTWCENSKHCTREFPKGKATACSRHA